MIAKRPKLHLLAKNILSLFALQASLYAIFSAHAGCWQLWFSRNPLIIPMHLCLGNLRHKLLIAFEGRVR